MLAAVLFQSPIVSALLLLICGLLLGYALGTGRMQESDALVSIATWLKAQPTPSVLSAPSSSALADPVAVLPWNEESPQDGTKSDALSQVERERDELARELAAAQDQMAGLHDDLASYQRAVETIERYRNEAREKLAREQERASELEDRCREQETLRSQGDAARDELDELRTYCASLQSQLATAAEGHRQAQLEWKTADNEVAHYQEQLADIQEQKRQVEGEVERLRADRESLLASLRGAQEQNRQLSQQLGDQETHAQQLIEELETLRVLQSHWETQGQSLAIAACQAPVVAATGESDAERVRTLEELVATLREQLRLVQLQAQELVQRQQVVFSAAGTALAGAAADCDDLTGGETGSRVGRSEDERRELVDRIRQQNRQLSGRDEAA